jgi:pimeloyl-ACP methyl ester carboxylesterase
MAVMDAAMTFSRRRLLQGAALLSAAGAVRWRSAQAQTASGPMPPIVFVHGNGDHAALWMTTLWRMESNGVPLKRLLAFNFTDPLARDDDGIPQANRSSTEDQRRELAEAVSTLKQRTGAERVALVANSRGGYAVRNFIRNGGGGSVSHAVLCGVPNHGVFAIDSLLGSEFNGNGPFLRGLNAGESEVVAGTAFLTLRSDGNDKYAQPDGRFMGKPGMPTNVTFEGPALRGATNLVLGAVDHRETAYSPRAFREIYKFIAGREPDRIAIVPEATVRLSGLVTGLAGAEVTNRPVSAARVEVYRVNADSGERIGDALYTGVTAAGGQWGPATVDPASPLEIVLSVPGSPITHYYRSPFPRSSDVVHLRPARLPAADDAAAIVQMTRPRGYFGLPRDIVLLDGREPQDIKPGVPTDATTTLRLPASETGRAVVGMFNLERIAARAWPLSENRIAVAELTG